jgi:hypothetical protein
MVYPVVLGVGERLFGETSDKKFMRLVGNRTVDDLAFLGVQPRTLPANRRAGTRCTRGRGERTPNRAWC